MSRYEILAAGEIARNTRVVREEDTLPYLVDQVEAQKGGPVTVTFSSGDEVVYPSATHPVIVVAD